MDILYIFGMRFTIYIGYEPICSLEWSCYETKISCFLITDY